MGLKRRLSRPGSQYPRQRLTSSSHSSPRGTSAVVCGRLRTHIQHLFTYKDTYASNKSESLQNCFKRTGPPRGAQADPEFMTVLPQPRHELRHPAERPEQLSRLEQLRPRSHSHAFLHGPSPRNHREHTGETAHTRAHLTAMCGAGKDRRITRAH